MKVIIIGGGIGGLCTALAMRTQGIDPVIYERAAEPGDVGAGLMLWPNAMKVLSALGADAAVIAAGARLIHSRLCTANGKTLHEARLDELETRVGAPVVAIHRAALHRILAEALEAGRLRFAMPCVNVVQHADSVTVQFANGASDSADLLVGADGIRSTVRGRMFPHVQLRYSGYTAWRGIVETTDEAALGVTTEVWGMGARFGIVRVDRSRVYWFATYTQPAGEISSPEERKAKLLSVFGTWCAPVPHLLEATPAAAILHNDIYDIRSFAPWSREQVTLLGDAAHPTTPNMGQGACMAIESAYVLAHALAQEPGLPSALHRYEAERRARTRWVTNTSWSIGRGAQIDHPALCLLRNWLVRSLPSSMFQSLLWRAAGYDVTAS